MVEFTVALVVIMVLLAGLIQVCQLGNAHTQTMITARREAGNLAISDTYVAPPQVRYIFDWISGADGKRYTADDYPFTSTNVTEATQTIIDVAHPDEIASYIPENVFSSMGGLLSALDAFSFVRGYDSDSVSTFPVVRNLIYRGASISVESEVWLTWTEGLY